MRAIQAPSADVMPPVSHGGPWPEEWVQLVHRWVSEGNRRLGLGTATQVTAQPYGTVVSLTAEGIPLGANATVWLDPHTGAHEPDSRLLPERGGVPPPGQTSPVL